MESPIPLTISPASKFLSYFETLLSSILYFRLSFENLPRPLLVDSTRVLVTINSLPFFPSLPFHFKPMSPSIGYCTCFLEITSTYWMWRHFTYQEMTAIYLPGDDDTLPTATRRWRHFTYQETTSLYLPGDEDALPNCTKLMNYSWIHTPSSVVVVSHRHYWHTSGLIYK